MIRKVLRQIGHEQTLDLLIGFGQQIHIAGFGHDCFTLRVPGCNYLFLDRRSFY